MSDAAVVRCWNCNLNQFDRLTCRRCHKPLEQVPIEELPEPTDRPTKASWKADSYHEAMAARIGRRFKAARLAKGFSQRQLAEILNKPRTYLSKIENGNLEPQYKQLVVLSKALGVTVRDFIDSNRELETRLIFADPFLTELAEAGRGMKAMFWKKTADAAERMSNGKRLSISA